MNARTRLARFVLHSIPEPFFIRSVSMLVSPVFDDYRCLFSYNFVTSKLQ